MAKGWKEFEARVARRFGLLRRGADYRNRYQDGGNDDAVEAPGQPLSRWSLECTLQSRLNYRELLAKCFQAERNARDGKVPIVVAKLKGALDADALVVMRLDAFERYLDPRAVQGLPLRPDTPPGPPNRRVLRGALH